MVLISTVTNELKEMSHGLKKQAAGMRMNISKSDVSEIQITLDNHDAENVSQNKYQGYIVKLGTRNQTAEIERRISLTWALHGFWKPAQEYPEQPRYSNQSLSIRLVFYRWQHTVWIKYPLQMIAQIGKGPWKILWFLFL